LVCLVEGEKAEDPWMLRFIRVVCLVVVDVVVMCCSFEILHLVCAVEGEAEKAEDPWVHGPTKPAWTLRLPLSSAGGSSQLLDDFLSYS